MRRTLETRLASLIKAGALALALMGSSIAAKADVPHVFQAGSRARASEVNENFAVLVERLKDLEARLGQVERDRDDLEARLGQAERERDGLQAALAFVTDYVTDLSRYVEVHHVAPPDTAARGPIVRVRGANLQIVNAAGEQTTPDGTGNLIVGFAKARTEGASGYAAQPVCSDGRYSDPWECENNGEVWGYAHNSGSHNIVGGSEPAYSRTGGIVVGRNNAITADGAAVIGGEKNVARGAVASITGGSRNRAIGVNSSVTGGQDNEASAPHTSVTGGAYNKASGPYATVTSGEDNVASGLLSSVSGGMNNVASGSRSSISGGGDLEATQGNEARGSFSSISGGRGCTVTTHAGWGAAGAGACP